MRNTQLVRYDLLNPPSGGSSQKILGGICLSEDKKTFTGKLQMSNTCSSVDSFVCEENFCVSFILQTTVFSLQQFIFFILDLPQQSPSSE